MIHLLLALATLQNPENYYDSLYKYKLLWRKEVDSLKVYSHKIIKMEENKKEVKKKRELFNKCMDRSVDDFQKYFEYKKKVDSIKLAKSFTT